MKWHQVVVPFAGWVVGYLAGVVLAQVMQIDIWPLVFSSSVVGGFFAWRFVQQKN